MAELKALGMLRVRRTQSVFRLRIEPLPAIGYAASAMQIAPIRESVIRVGTLSLGAGSRSWAVLTAAALFRGEY